MIDQLYLLQLLHDHIGITIILFVLVKFLTCYSQHHKIFKLFENNLSTNIKISKNSYQDKHNVT